MGRVTLVTGGATGLGRATAEALCALGHKVCVTYRKSAQAGEAFVREMEGRGLVARAIRADAGRAEDVERVFSDVEASFGPVEVLVHAAGPFRREKVALADTSLEDWREMLDGNATSAFLHVRRAVPHMRRAGFGRMIFFGYDKADKLLAWPGRAAYAAAKSAVASMAQTVAREEAGRGITVHLVCPGNIGAAHKQARRADVAGMDSERVPVGRPGSGEDVARVVAFLVDEASDFLTGSTVYVGGGEDVV